MIGLRKDRIKVGFYPYTYVRTNVMKSLLFKKGDYDKMLKMSFSEIARFLQESNYKKEINHLANEMSGADLLEAALNMNFAESTKKLIRISSEELALLVKEYSLRKDVDDLKTVLRGKFTKASAKTIGSSITGAGTMSRDFFMNLFKKETIEQILKGNGFVEYSVFKNPIVSFRETNNLFAIENALDKYYYSHMIQFSSRISKQGDLFRKFLQKEVEMLNLLTIFRLKKEGMKPNEITGFLIIGNGNNSLLKELALAKDFDEIAKMLSKTEYKEVVLRGIEEFKKTNSLIPFETEIYKTLLKKTTSFAHQNLLSVDVILGYMFAKDMEVRNIKIIVKGKQLGLNENFIRNQLIIE